MFAIGGERPLSQIFTATAPSSTPWSWAGGKLAEVANKRCERYGIKGENLTLRRIETRARAPARRSENGQTE